MTDGKDCGIMLEDYSDDELDELFRLLLGLLTAEEQAQVWEKVRELSRAKESATNER